MPTRSRSPRLCRNLPFKLNEDSRNDKTSCTATVDRHAASRRARWTRRCSCRAASFRKASGTPNTLSLTYRPAASMSATSWYRGIGQTGLSISAFNISRLAVRSKIRRCRGNCIRTFRPESCSDPPSRTCNTGCVEDSGRRRHEWREDRIQQPSERRPNEDRLVAMGHPCAHRAIRQIRVIRRIRVSSVDAFGAAKHPRWIASPRSPDASRGLPQDDSRDGQLGSCCPCQR
jgi:hypothetical protein